MNLREEIIYNIDFNPSRKSKLEEKRFVSFVEAFNEDVEVLGEEKTLLIYSMIFGEELKEDFEGALNELKQINETLSEEENALNEASIEPGLAGSFIRKASKSLGDVKDPLKLSWADRARRLLFPQKPVAKFIGQGQALGTKALDASTKPFNFSGKLLGVWNKVKGFFKGQFNSIVGIVKTGQWSKLFALPLFKGALAAGGVVALIAILKKIFGKKKIEAQEAKIKEQAAEAGY